MECRFVDPDSFLILLYIYMYMVLFRMILFSNTRNRWLLCTVCSRICVFCLTLHSVWPHIRAACINVRLCLCVWVYIVACILTFFSNLFFFIYYDDALSMVFMSFVSFVQTDRRRCCLCHRLSCKVFSFFVLFLCMCFCAR